MLRRPGRRVPEKREPGGGVVVFTRARACVRAWWAPENVLSSSRRNSHLAGQNEWPLLSIFGRQVPLQPSYILLPTA